MVLFRGFRGWRPQPGSELEVASVPYDVVNREEAVALAEGKRNSFLHVVRPDIDLPADTSPYSDVMYQTAKENLDRLIRDQILIQDAEPTIYLYRQQMELFGTCVSQTGVVGCCHIDDYLQNRIKKHEKTRQAKEDDRTRHVRTLDAHTGPVFLLHKDDTEIDQLVAMDTESMPLYDFEAEDGVRHTVWKVADPQAYTRGFSNHDAVYVADGHHRSASAARAGNEIREETPNTPDDAESNWFLAVLFSASDLSILPYHRVVKDLNGKSAEAIRGQLQSVGTLKPADTAMPAAAGAFGVYLDGDWWTLTLDPNSIDHDDPIRSLDYVLLSERVLGPLLGIEDIRTDNRIDFVGGIRGTVELERRVDSGDMAIAFAMYPTTVDQLLAVADADAIMPPKSTWFEPKLRSGLLVHTLDTIKR